MKEMFFGLAEEFFYFQCMNCGCLQICEIPDNVSKYYPQNYYSLNTSFRENTNKVKQVVRQLWSRYAIFGEGFIGLLIYHLFPADALRMLSRINLSTESRILDVGCGTGYLLNCLRELGIKNLLGVDPHIESDWEGQDGLKILKKTIHDIEGKWDLIMFQHSFEHLSDPLETLYRCKKLLSLNGICLISMPVVDSWAWENYKENWVQADVPRHFFLHSRKSMKILSEKAKLKIEKIICNSTAFQFWGSEQCKRSITLNAENSYDIDHCKSIFSKKEIKIFTKKAKALNFKNLGDQAIFYIQHAEDGSKRTLLNLS